MISIVNLNNCLQLVQSTENYIIEYRDPKRELTTPMFQKQFNSKLYSKYLYLFTVNPYKSSSLQEQAEPIKEIHNFWNAQNC